MSGFTERIPPAKFEGPVNLEDCETSTFKVGFSFPVEEEPTQMAAYHARMRAMINGRTIPSIKQSLQFNQEGITALTEKT